MAKSGPIYDFCLRDFIRSRGDFGQHADAHRHLPHFVFLGPDERKGRRRVVSSPSSTRLVLAAPDQPPSQLARSTRAAASKLVVRVLLNQTLRCKPSRPPFCRALCATSLHRPRSINSCIPTLPHSCAMPHPTRSSARILARPPCGLGALFPDPSVST